MTLSNRTPPRLELTGPSQRAAVRAIASLLFRNICLICCLELDQEMNKIISFCNRFVSFEHVAEPVNVLGRSLRLILLLCIVREGVMLVYHLNGIMVVQGGWWVLDFARLELTQPSFSWSWGWAWQYLNHTRLELYSVASVSNFIFSTSSSSFISQKETKSLFSVWFLCG